MKIIEDDTPGQFFDGIASLPLFLQDINLSFDTVGDAMPLNRVKILHPTGIVALFKFVSKQNHTFTGAFKGTDHGLMRISEVGTVKRGEDPSTSAGFKFFRDGVESGNMFTLHAFEGHGVEGGENTYNFLRRDIDYNTHVDLPTNRCNLMTSHAKLSQVSKHVGNMSVKGLADYDQYGNRESRPNWPFMMRLLPRDPCPATQDDFHIYYDHLPKCVPAGTKLFDVMALADPKELGGVEQEIGYIETTSKMTTSLYGDTRLYFRHQRFEEDLAARPHWKEHIEEFDMPTFHENLPLPLDAPEQCPFAYLFGLI